MLHVQESVNLTIYLYATYIFIYISIHRWDTGTQLQWRLANMARNDLSARGAWGGAKRPTN